MSQKRFSARKLLVLALGTAAALSLAAPAAALDKVNVSGTIQFTPPSDFHGRVNSKEDDCESGARVNLLRYQNSNDTTGDVVGTDKANRKGVWGIMVTNAQAGEFQIQIAGRKVGEHDFLMKCKAFVGARVQF
jgi:hypothetical protein